MNKTSGTSSSPRPTGQKAGPKGRFLSAPKDEYFRQFNNYLECMLGILTLSRERFGPLS